MCSSSHVCFTDSTSGFKCWRRETLESVGVEEAFSNGYLFQIETTYKTYNKKLKIVEIPITFFDRSNGHSKMNWNIVLEALWGVLRLRLITFFDRSNGHSKMNRNIVLEALWGVLRLRLRN